MVENPGKKYPSDKERLNFPGPNLRPKDASLPGFSTTPALDAVTAEYRV